MALASRARVAGGSTARPCPAPLAPLRGACAAPRRRGTAARALPASPVVRELPTQVAETFYVVQDPALFNTSYSDALLRFVDAAILAYECGMNEDSLRHELKVYKASLEQSLAPPGMALNDEGCMLGAKIVWITLMETRSVRRWAAYNPVTDDTLSQWSGFVTMIVDGYFNRRMAWFPVERLQLELSVQQDLSAPPHDVAEWARIVYTVLEKVHPQFPSERARGAGRRAAPAAAVSISHGRGGGGVAVGPARAGWSFGPGALSAAAAFRVGARAAAVVVAFLVAFSTGGFWVKVRHEVAQPTVHYSGDALLVLESLMPGQELVWTTSPALAAALPANTLSAAVQVGEEDGNHDGKPDLIRFTARVRSPVPVHSCKLLLQFTYALQARRRRLLLLQQASPLPAGAVLVAPDKPLPDGAGGPGALGGEAALDLAALLRSYQARNATTVFANHYGVWKAGSGQDFVVDATVRLPSQVITYRPGPSEMLKWGWVQFVATWWAVWAFGGALEGVVLRYRLLETRVVSDAQPRQQRF
ncbi:TMEM231 [Scenedesmus sp. PABB004]|nr:TMEM231 [Scenedesmus sp. PABB004]